MADPLCVGTGPLSSLPHAFGYEVGREQALATLRAVFAGPIRFLDTSNGYGDGRSEEYIGIVRREMGGYPPDFLISTKADRDMKTGDFSGDRMRRSVEESQQRLGMDRFPLFFLHDPEHAPFEYITAKGGALDALLKLRDEGVIEHLGVAGGPIDLLMRYVETGAFEAVLTHNRYNLLTREAEPLLQLAHERGLAILNAAPYGSGILAKGPSVYGRFRYQPAPPEIMERARQLEAICARHGVPLAAAALQFSLRDPRISSTVVGITHPIRVAQTVALARFPAPEEMWEEIEQAIK